MANNPYDPVVLEHYPRHHHCTGDDDGASASFSISSYRSRTTNEIADKASKGCEMPNEARQKLQDWNFDPNDASKGGKEWCSSPLLNLQSSAALHHYRGNARESRPMIIFAQLGDVPMMRYIMKNTTLDSPLKELSMTDEHGLFPLYTAISDPHPEDHVLSVCQWLHDQGANLRQTLGDEWSPLSRACLKGFEKVAVWLVQSGALLLRQDGTGERSFDIQAAKRDLPSNGEFYGIDGSTRSVVNRIHRKIFCWAKDVVSTRDTFFLFLTGVLLPPPPPFLLPSMPSVETNKSIDSRRKQVVQRLVKMISLGGNDDPTASTAAAISLLVNSVKDDDTLIQFLEMTNKKNTSPIVVFNGHSGVLELISEFVGVETDPNVLCTARGLVAYHKEQHQ